MLFPGGGEHRAHFLLTSLAATSPSHTHPPKRGHSIFNTQRQVLSLSLFFSPHCVLFLHALINQSLWMTYEYPYLHQTSYQSFKPIYPPTNVSSPCGCLKGTSAFPELNHDLPIHQSIVLFYFPYFSKKTLSSLLLYKQQVSRNHP